jgi:hypothetical protein
MAPCHIGLDCTGEGAAPLRITVNLQSTLQPDFTNYQFALTTWNVELVGGIGKTTLIHTDATYTLAFPLTIGKATGPGVPDLAADTWHHLLISWDVTGSISCGGDSTVINSNFKMYLALDGKNYSKGDLPANWIGDAGGTVDMPPGSAGTEPNTILTTDSALNDLPWPGEPEIDEPDYYHNGWPPGSFAGTIGSLSATKLYVPGSPHYTDDSRDINSIYQVEMAELQIFLDRTLDTSIEKNRQAFIDYERDSAGKPVADKDGNLTLKPVAPAKAEDLLKKRPEVLLHGTDNWKVGKNTGSLGINAKDEIIAAGQFKPTGKIEKYEPDPSITQPSASGTLSSPPQIKVSVA